MAMTSDQLYDWISTNWLNKANYEEGSGTPTTPPSTNFVIYNDITNKIIYTWDSSKEVWKEGLGGGGTYESIIVTDNTEISALPNIQYILNSVSVADKIIKLDNALFEEIGDSFKIIDNGIISESVTISIVPNLEEEMNGINDLLEFDVMNGMIEITKVDNNEFIVKSYGTSSGAVSSSKSFIHTSFEPLNKKYLVDCTSNTVTATVPPISNFKSGQEFSIWDYKKNCQTNMILVDFTTNNYKLDGTVQNYIFDVNGDTCRFIFVDADTGFVTLNGQF